MDLTLVMVADQATPGWRAALAAFPPLPGVTVERILVAAGGVATDGAAVDRVVTIAQDPGPAAAFNRGLDQARGDFLLLWRPERPADGACAGAWLAFLRAHPAAGMVGTAGYSCLLIRRAVLERIGGLDEGYQRDFFWEDYGRRVVTHGFEVWFGPDRKARCLSWPAWSRPVKQGGGRPDGMQAIDRDRDRQRYLRKHAGWVVAALWRVVAACVSALECLAYLLVFWFFGGTGRLKEQGVRLAGHLLGQPRCWGVSPARAAYTRVRRSPCTWFVAEGFPAAAVPAGDPDTLVACGSQVVKQAKATHVTTGVWQGELFYFKRYNYRGRREALRNILWLSRARHCFEVAQQLTRLGFHTPAAVLACERRAGWWLRESYLVTRAMPAMDLDKWVAANGYTDELIRQVAGLIRRLHERGVLHLDLKGRNLLRGEDGAIYLIDLDRCRIGRALTLRARAKNLSYLNASFEDLLPQEKRCLFLAEYVKGDRRLEQRQEWLARKIVRFSRQRGRTRRRTAPPRLA
jgi:tRNA A-37 threonylcarbamoyl transferase component Bud32